MELLSPEKIKERAYCLDIEDYSHQTEMTGQLVLPYLEEVRSNILTLRKEVDKEFEKQKTSAQPLAYGVLDINNYPIGFCRQIRDKLFQRLKYEALFKKFIDAESGAFKMF